MLKYHILFDAGLELQAASMSIHPAGSSGLHSIHLLPQQVPLDPECVG